MTDKSITVWGDQSVDETRGIETLRKSYGLHHSDEHPFGQRFTIGDDGTVYALVKGDMGYDATHIVIRRDDILSLVSDWPEYVLKDASDKAIADAYARGVADARKVKPLAWGKDPAKDAYYAGDFVIYKLDNGRRDIWRLLQADLCTKYRGDFGGNDALDRAMDAAQEIQDRRIQSALVDPMQTPSDLGQEYNNDNET